MNDTYISKNESQRDSFDHPEHPETIVIINCALNVPLMFISIIGNALVLVAILRTSSLHSPSTVFLCCLAVSDLLVGCVAQPVYVATELHGGPSLYHAMFTLTALTCGVSLCVMAAISVDRFIALHCHMRYPNLTTTKRVIYTSATLWIINILLSSLSFWNIDVYFLAIAIGIAICISVSSVSYIRIYRIVRQHRIQIHFQQQAVQRLNAAESMQMLRLKKSVINTFLYFLCMTLCYSPLFTSMLILAMKQDTKVWNLADTVCFMNSSINPFLYCWRLRELRTAILNTLRKIICKHTE